jgi:hypothetical protein
MGVIESFLSLSPEERKSVYKFVLISDLQERIKQLENETKITMEIRNILNTKPMCDNIRCLSILELPDYKNWYVPYYYIRQYANSKSVDDYAEYTFYKDIKIGLNKHQYETLFN